MKPAALRKKASAGASRVKKKARGVFVRPTRQQLLMMEKLLRAIDMPPQAWGRLGQ
jgi:hypothetical protein